MDYPRQFLDLPAKLYQRSVIRSAAAVSRGATSPTPLVIELDPTSFCDLACPECISTSILNANRFSRERLEQLATEAVELGVRAVIFIGGGEPLLHHGTASAIRRLSEGGVAIGITTNGTQMHRYRDLIAERVAWCRISVDAATANIYNRFRPSRSGRGAFDTVVNNIKALTGRSRGRIGFSFLLISRETSDCSAIDSNVGEMAAAVRLADDLGCDYIEIKSEYDMNHYVAGRRKSLGAEIREQLVEIEQLRQKLAIEIVLQENLTRALAGDGPQVQKKEYSRCSVAELRTLVTPSGAYICPYHRGNPRARYGDPQTETLREMWSSANRKMVVDRIQPSRDCGFSCIRHESNLAITNMGGRNESENEVDDYDPFL